MDEEIEKGILSFIGCVTLTILNIVLHGYVFSLLWKWFVVGFGVPAISITQAIGLSLLVFAICPVSDSNVKDRKFMDLLAGSFGKAFMALGIGYIVHLFM
jgi:hypothetical protein